MLDAAVGKVDGVRSSNNTVTVVVLLLLESSAAVVISHGVGVLVGGGLGQVVSDVAGLHGGVVGSGSGVGSGGGGISWGSMDSVVGNWVNSVVSDGVDGVMGNGVDSMVGDRGNRVERDHSSLAYWDWPVGSNGGLDLSQTLGVVGLSHGGVGGSESLGLAESSDLTVSGGD